MLVATRRICLLTLLLAAAAGAQTAEVGVSFKRSMFSEGGLGEVGLIPQRFEMQNGSGVNLHLTINGRSLFAHELTYGYEKDGLTLGNNDQGSIQVHKFYYDFVVHAVKPDKRVRPFVFGGAGLATFLLPSGAAIQASNLTKFGANFGGGVKARVTDHVGIRFDVRDHLLDRPNFFDLPGVEGRLHNVEIAVGASWLF